MPVFNLKFCVLMLLSLSAHAAGPGDGGGTNLFEDELVDFVKFKEQYGEHMQPMNPRKFRAKGEGTPVLSQVQGTLDRMEYLYPGKLGTFLDATFKKPWLIVDKEFTARSTGEKKVVSQTDDAVFVSLPWLKKASPEQLRKVFVHEAVRNWATQMVNDATYGIAYETFCEGDPARAKAEAKRLREKYADLITEEVTPLVYQKLQFSMIDRTGNKVLKDLERDLAAYEKLRYADYRKAKPHDNVSCKPFDRERHPLVIYSREDMYRELKGTEADKLIERICRPLLDSRAKPNSPEREKLIIEALDEVLAKAPKEYILKDYDNRRCELGSRLSYSDSLAVIGVVDITRYVGALAFPSRACADQNEQMRNTSDFKAHVVQGMNFYCSGIGNSPATAQFLKEWKADGGRIRDSLDPGGVEEVPEEKPAGMVREAR